MKSAVNSYRVGIYETLFEEEIGGIPWEEPGIMADFTKVDYKNSSKYT